MATNNGEAVSRLAAQVRTNLTEPRPALSIDERISKGLRWESSPVAPGMSLFELCEHMAKHSDRNASALERIGELMERQTVALETMAAAAQATAVANPRVHEHLRVAMGEDPATDRQAEPAEGLIFGRGVPPSRGEQFR